MAMRTVLYCLLGGLSLTIAAAGAGHFGWWWVAGIVLSAAFVPVARFGPRGWLAQFGIILLSLIVVWSLGTESEVALFYPGLRGTIGRDLVAMLVMNLIVALVLASLGRLLNLTDVSGPLPERQSGLVAGGMVVVSGFVYVVCYLIFGWITYANFTHQYYPWGHDYARSLGLLLWEVELARGIAMTIAVLPVIYTLRMRRWSAAIAIGALLWVVGGVTPLLVPNPLMVTAQRYIHIVEILTQNASLGIAAVLLLRPGRRRSIASEMVTAR